MTQESRFRIAIVGGGIAGFAASAALRHLPVQVDVYEQAAELTEVGATIALGPNGLRTLALLGLKAPDDLGYRSPGGVDHVWKDGKTGEHIHTTKYPNYVVDNATFRTTRFTRSDLYNFLRGFTDPKHVHLNKRFTAINVHHNGATLTFADGSTAEADLVIGADGIKSPVRNHFVPNHALPYAGATAYREVYSWDLVKHIGLPLESTHWTSSRGKTVFTTPLVGNRLGIAAFLTGQDPKTVSLGRDWDREVDIELLRREFADWCSPIKQMFDALPSVKSYPVYTGDSLQKWSFENRVTLLGDAAHPHGGSFAAGGSLAIDDAYALTRALEVLFFQREQAGKPSAAELGAVLNLYDATRNEHGKRIIDAVASKKRAAQGIRDYVASDDDVLRAPLWIVDHQVDAEWRRVLKEQGRLGGVSEQARL